MLTIIVGMQVFASDARLIPTQVRRLAVALVVECLALPSQRCHETMDFEVGKVTMYAWIFYDFLHKNRLKSVCNSFKSVAFQQLKFFLNPLSYMFFLSDRPEIQEIQETRSSSIPACCLGCSPWRPIGWVVLRSKSTKKAFQTGKIQNMNQSPLITKERNIGRSRKLMKTDGAQKTLCWVLFISSSFKVPPPPTPASSQLTQPLSGLILCWIKKDFRELLGLGTVGRRFPAAVGIWGKPPR